MGESWARGRHAGMGSSPCPSAGRPAAGGFQSSPASVTRLWGEAHPNARCWEVSIRWGTECPARCWVAQAHLSPGSALVGRNEWNVSMVLWLGDRCFQKEKVLGKIELSPTPNELVTLENLANHSRLASVSSTCLISFNSEDRGKLN